MGEPEPPAAARAPEALRGAASDPHAWARAAFLPLWVQVQGLIGSHGILPFGELLELGRTRLGISRYWVLPTVLWMGGGDAALHVVCAAGTMLAIVAMLGRARALSM